MPNPLATFFLEFGFHVARVTEMGFEFSLHLPSVPSVLLPALSGTIGSSFAAPLSLILILFSCVCVCFLVPAQRQRVAPREQRVLLTAQQLSISDKKNRNEPRCDGGTAASTDTNTRSNNSSADRKNKQRIWKDHLCRILPTARFRCVKVNFRVK